MKTKYTLCFMNIEKIFNYQKIHILHCGSQRLIDIRSAPIASQKVCAAVFNQRLSTSIFASLMEWAKADIIFGLPEDRTSSLLVLTTSATNKLLFIEYFWYFQGRQIGGLQRVKPNYAHPFASRASFFGAKPPSSEHPKKSHLLKKKCYYSHEIFKVNHLIGEF